MSHIFISYSHIDRDYALKLQRHMVEQGFDAWIDDRIDYGVHWPRELEIRLRECDAFILIMSPNSYESEWVQNELSFARQLNKPIFPLLLDGDVWWHLQTTQYVDVRKGKLPPDKFFVRLEDFVHSGEVGGDSDGSLTEKEKQELELKKIESKAIQYELRGDFWNALQSWYKIKRIDPSYPRVDVKIDELEQELRREKEEREHVAVERKAARQASWLAFIQKITSILNTTKQRVTSLKIDRKTLRITSLATVVITAILIVFVLVNNYPLFFSGVSSGVSGGTENIYSYKGKAVTQITQAAVGAKNWSPTRGIGGTLYFTSNRSGKAEIYGFNTLNGDLWKITTTPGGAESWSPATGVGENMYFTSNRSGKAEIYGFNTLNGELWQITATPGKFESWSPALGIGGIVYFTSNRSGKAEIYGFNTLDGELWQITSTPGGAESWSPAIGLGNNLFFTSNRTGKAEVYKFDTKTGELEQMTNTPGNAESWAPVLLGNKIYITSNRSGRSKVYLFGQEDAAITEIESWTKKINDRIPGY